MRPIAKCVSDPTAVAVRSGSSKRIWPALLACLLFGFVHSQADATVLVPVTERELTSEAELIFQGVVERVEYAFSQPRSKTDKPVPHTFVTFKIEEIIKGHTENEKALTLRFVGGPYDKARFLLVPQVPLFEIGDREILFVTGNGTRACPLVGWSQGRIQVIGDSVFSDDGREVWLSEKGTMTFGRAHNLKEVQTERIGETVIRRVTVAPTGETPRREGRVALGRRMNHEAFVDYLRNLIRPHLAAQPTLPIIPVKSAQPGQPFEFGITQAPPRGDRLLRRNNEGKAAQ